MLVKSTEKNMEQQVKLKPHIQNHQKKTSVVLLLAHKPTVSCVYKIRLVIET